MFQNRYILVLLIVLSALALHSKGSFQVIEENENYILLDFVMPDYEIKSYSKHSENVQRIEVPGSLMLAEPGFPKLPYFADIVGIPVDGNISLSIENIQYENVIIENLEVADNHELKGDKLVYEAYRATELSQRSFYPSIELKKGESGFAGDRHFVGFQFFPFTYRNEDHSVRVATKARLKIMISGTKSRIVKTYQTGRGIYDKHGDNMFINNNTSKGWRLPKNKDYTSDCQIQRDDIVNQIQILVKEDGIYKVTKEFLVDALREAAYEYQFTLGFDLDEIDPHYLELKDEHGIIPIRFFGEEDGVFDNGDYFEFWGERNRGETSYYDDYTDTNVYILYVKDTNGARLAVENGGLLVNASNQLIRPDAFEEELHIENQYMLDKLARGYSSSTPFFREDNWFWNRIAAPNLKVFNFNVPYPISSSIRTFQAEVCLYGLTYAASLAANEWDHHAVVRLNSSLIDNDENGVTEPADTYWRGQKEKIFKNYNPLGNANLYHGANSLFISMPGDTVSGDKEVILLDYIKLKYWREFKTDTDILSFNRPSNRPYGLYEFAIDGFSSDNISVYKLGTAQMENVQITPFSETGGAPYMVTFQDSVISEGFEYVAVEESAKLQPEQILPDYPSYLKSHSNRADLVIITINDFLGTEGLDNIQSHWEELGQIVKVVDVQDVYDEFNNGIKSAQSIKDFLSYAYNNWSYPQLKYAVLIGDGTYNENDNNPLEEYNMIPVKKVWTANVGATACDVWYGCIVGDDFVPDIVVSRIPARDAEEIQNVYEKVNKYTSAQDTDSAWRGRITLAAGGTDGEGHDVFSQQEEAIRRYGIPEEYFVTRVYTTTVAPTPSGYYGGTFKLKDSISDGLSFLQFMGHGGGRIWADYNLMNYNDIRTLTNDDYFIVSSLSCFGGAFDSSEPCINEGFLLEQGKGSVGSIGFTGVGYVDFDLYLGLILVESLFNPSFDSIGESINYSLANYYATEYTAFARDGLISAFSYLGDPVLSLSKLESELTSTINKTLFAPGDTISVSVEFPESVETAIPIVLDENELALNYLYELPIYNGIFEFEYVIPENTSPQYLSIRIAGLSPEKEYVSLQKIPVYEHSVNMLKTNPESPDYDDLVNVSASVLSENNIEDVYCQVKVGEYFSSSSQVIYHAHEEFDIPMEFIDANTIQTVYPINPDTLIYSPGYEVQLKVVATTDTDIVESSILAYNIKGPDLSLNYAELDVINQQSGVNVNIANYGNTVSPNSTITIYRYSGLEEVILDEYSIDSINPAENRTIFCPLQLVDTENFTAYVEVNKNREFDEISFDNNLGQIRVTSNYYYLDSNEQIIESSDGNLQIKIPTAFGTNNTIVELTTTDQPQAIAQPDIYSVQLHDNASSKAYKIHVHDTSFVDSLGFFANNRELKITMNFSETDSLTQSFVYSDSYRLYLWNEDYSKWFYCGGLMHPEQNQVSYSINRNGIYSLFRNEDRTAPSIEANVAEQEFTRGGYIASDGTISFSFYDQNGIDVINAKPKLYLNGVDVDLSYITMAINKDNLNSVPLNYELDLEVGTYTIKAECSDINGNYKELLINFRVNDEFEILNLANYPNPVVGHAIEPVNDGRTRFTYLLTAPAERVTMKIYTVSGRLVKTFKNMPKGVGYHEYPRTVYGWDCKDDDGFYLANGVYFYKLIAKNGEKTIEKIQKMAILR